MPPNFGAAAGQSSPVETTARPVGTPLYLPCAYTCSTFAQQCLLGSSLRNQDLLPAHAFALPRRRFLFRNQAEGWRKNLEIAVVCCRPRGESIPVRRGVSVHSEYRRAAERGAL